MSDPANSLILTGFADEAANQKTIDQQFSAFAALGLEYLTLRFIDAGGGVKNVMQLQDSEIESVKEKLQEYGLRVSSIGSPIGKVKLLDVDDGSSNQYFPFEDYLNDQVERACQLATTFESKLIRGFSFYHPIGQKPEEHLDLVVEQLKAIAERCDQSGLTFGLEVEANLVGQNGELLKQIHESVGSDALVLIFDGGNLVTQGYSAAQVFEQYQLMKPGLGWIHIKDFHVPEGMKFTGHVDEEALKHFVPADQGDSGHLAIMKDLKEFLPELNQRMKSRGAPGVFADLEPHLKGGGQFGGFSGPDGFGVALRSFQEICKASGVDCRTRDFSNIKASRGF